MHMEELVKLVLSGDPRIVAGFVAGTVTGLSAGFTGGKLFGNWSLNRRLADSEKQLGALKASLDDSVNLWLRKVDRPDDYVATVNRSIPIITVVNLKGGVGKTTIAANLIGYFSEQKRRDGSPLRILAIDLDYQGSLSAMLLTSAGITTHKTTSDTLIDPRQSKETAKARAENLRPKYENVWLYSAYEDFLEVENRLMMEWIIQRDPNVGDVRYELHRKLQSPGFLADFDLAMIDGPPRMTTGFVAALCASTHLLMPTIADKLSAPAAIRFLKQLEQLRPTLFPATKLLGIVPSRTYKAESLTNKESDVIATMLSDLERLHRIFDVNVFRNEIVPHTASFISAAGSELAYFDTQDAVPKQAISRLGAAIKQRINLAR